MAAASGWRHSYVQTDGAPIPAAQARAGGGGNGAGENSRAGPWAIDAFYNGLTARLADDAVWSRIAAANANDVARATARGRSTTRLIADDRMRRRMIEGLGQWRAMPSLRGRVLATTEHPGWRVEQVADGLGVVAFVFEGRPNVFADATGVLSGNTAVLQIGSDALSTARAMKR
jgi:glutamate-5-semialdehyde dehydrogenase